MKKLIKSLAVVLFFAGCASNSGLYMSGVMLPIDYQVKTPSISTEAQRETAKFSGIYYGRWPTADIQAVLVVEEIIKNEARVIYSWNSPKIQGGPERYSAKINLSNRTLEWGDGVQTSRFIFKLSDDGQSLTAFRELGNRSVSTVFYKQ